MAANESKQGRVIGDVGVLDLRNATEDTLAGVSRIGDVGVVFYSRENASLVSQLNIQNVGAMIEAPRNAKVTNGQAVLTHESFANLSEPINIAINGQLVIMPDVEVADIENGVAGIAINGQMIYPEHIAGAVQSRILGMNGQARPYRVAENMTFAVRRTTIDESYLNSLDDSTNIVTVGRAFFPDVLPNDLLRRKIGSLQVIGRVRFHEENAQTIMQLMGNMAGEARVTVIPAVHEFVEMPLELNSAVLESLTSRSLYCADRVHITADVTPELLDEKLDSIGTQSVLVCPASLRSVLARKCNLLETRAVFYEGELWLVEDELEVVPSRFEFMEDKATLVVFGELTIPAEVEPRVLAERLAKVHNFGEIICGREQMGAIQARLGISDGELVDLSKRHETGGDAGYLSL